MLIDDDREYVDVDECARRLNLDVPQVMELVRRRALRAVDYGFGEVWVEPALTNVTAWGF